MTELDDESFPSPERKMSHNDNNKDDNNPAKGEEETAHSEPHETIISTSATASSPSSSSSAQSITSPDTDAAMDETHINSATAGTDSATESNTGDSAESSPPSRPARDAITNANGDENDAKPPLNKFPQIQDQQGRDHQRGRGPGSVPRVNYSMTRTRRFTSNVVLLSSYNKRAVIPTSRRSQGELEGGKKKGKQSKGTRERVGSKRDLINGAKDKVNDFVKRNGDGNQRQASTAAELQWRREERDRLEAQRDSLAVAWMMGRHIRRVCRTSSPDGIAERSDLAGWKRYIKRFVAKFVDNEPAEPSFDPEVLARYIERLVMATDPWQEWFKELRRLYRWEQPLRTATWYAVFTYLWRKQRVMSFWYAYVIYIVLKRRLFPPHAQSVRESLDRALDRVAKARQAGELVTDRHAQERWSESLMRDASPQVQRLIGDLAASLEVLQNFYHWRRPKQTAASLFFFASCLAISLVGDTEFCLNVFWFLAINTFFLAWPVASHYPQHRFLASPFRWAFWDIPSHPEWAIQHLQRHDVLRQAESDVKQRASNDESRGFEDSSKTKTEMKRRRKGTGDSDDLLFPAFDNGRPGDLVLRSRDLCFVTGSRNSPHSGQEVAWSYPYSSLIQMAKNPDPRLEHLAGLELEVSILAETRGSSKTHDSSSRGTHQITLHLRPADRDEVFNLIVGRSQLPWRVCDDPSST